MHCKSMITRYNNAGDWMRGHRLTKTLFIPVLALVPLLQAQEPAAVFNRYCVTCHNARLKTGGFVLDPAEVSRVASNPELWEKVDRKLRSNAIPPAGVPCPDDAAYNSVASYIETELDRAAAARPNPGKLPPVHRLSRTEYQNSIRDLLALDALPKEMEYSLLLPPDNTSSGFDNLADLLFVSPSAMERYLDAAEKISRLAVGDRAAPVMVNIYNLPDEYPQTGRVDELPFGTRGGAAIRSDFPLDGEYIIKVELASSSRDPEQIEITIDGERVELAPIEAGRGGRGSRGTRTRDGFVRPGPPAKPLEF